MSTGPFFSVIIPTYNQAQFLGAALDSLLAQTDPDWEAVVMDDGSTDKTREVMEAYARKDARIRIFHKANGGVASALNEGLRRAQGKWICWLSSDDMFEPDKLETHRTWIDLYPDCRFFFTFFRLLRESTGQLTDHELWGPLPEREFQILGLFYRNYISGISICIDREAWIQEGSFDESLKYAQDIDMWLRLLARYPARFIPRWTCINRNHPLQGSEIFPQACYYDTSKAVIRFLNTHRFEELFPLLEFSDPRTALDAVEKTLEISAETSGLMYAMGPHYALLLSLLSWAWKDTSDQTHENKKRIRGVIRQRIAQIAQNNTETDFRLFWKGVQAAVQLKEPSFEFISEEPSAVGERYFYSKQTAGGAVLHPLQEYLGQFEGLTVTRWTGKIANSDIVMLLPAEIPLASRGENEKLRQAQRLARGLNHRGYRVLLVGHSNQTMGITDGIPFLGATEQDEINRLVENLGTIDTIIDLTLSQDIPRSNTKRTVRFPIPADGFIEANTIEQIVHQIESAPFQKGDLQVPNNRKVGVRKKQIIFLTRVLWGGGAERVVYELAQHLDKTRFEPHIVCLYEGGSTFSIDPSIPVQYVLPNPSTKPSRVVKKIYHALIRPSIRARLNLTENLHRWKGQIRSLKNPNNPFAQKKIIVQRSTDQSKKTDLDRLLESIENQWNNSPNPTPDDATTYELQDLIQLVAEKWPYVMGLRQIISGFQDDAIYIPIMEEAAILVWLTQFIMPRKYIASLHSVESYNLKLMYSEPKQYRMEEWLFINACKDAAIVVMPSEGCREDLHTTFGILKEHIRVFPNPLTATKFGEQTRGTEPEAAKNRKFKFIYVGRLAQDKNPGLLVEAAGLLKKRYADFAVYFIGKGPMHGELVNLIRERGLANHVFLLGEKANPYPWIAGARSLILTSHVESFALVLVEALFYGAVPIAVDCPFGPGEILEHGKHGILVPPNDPQLLSEKMWQIAHDDRLYARLRKSGLESAWKYNVSKIISKWENLIDEIQEPVKPQNQ